MKYYVLQYFWYEVRRRIENQIPNNKLKEFKEQFCKFAE
jgi:hypothetical protein